jgi:hypothetical protein
VSRPARLTPFALAFADLAAERFPGIRSALTEQGIDPADRDAFLMNREVVSLIRELRPDEGVGEEIGQLAALVHHVFLYWAAGAPTVELQADQLDALLGDSAIVPFATVRAPGYAQLPPRRIWAEPLRGSPHEPLDGCFIHAVVGSGDLRVLGVFGLHPDRQGFTVVEVAGPRVPMLARPDGSALFAPLLPGGAAAGLKSLAGGEELLELGYRLSGRAGTPEDRGTA